MYIVSYTDLDDFVNTNIKWYIHTTWQQSVYTVPNNVNQLSDNKTNFYSKRSSKKKAKQKIYTRLNM